jgi:uncharacterized membrane protein YgcG
MWGKSMIDMRAWEQITADVLDELHLDPRNVRLDGVADAPEADIMADLFHNEKALELVESIVRVGYLTHEVPIVVRRNRKLIVVEGNRRLAALKAIQNPYLVRSTLRNIEVKRAPNQTEADQLIAALHTGTSRVRWTPSRQAAFFQAQVDQGKTLKQLRSQYPTIDVEKFMLRSGIMNLFKSVSYSDPALSDLLASRMFPTSVLSRIYESKDFIEITGVRLDQNGDVQINVPLAAFGQMAENIMSGIKEGDIDTRSVNRVGSPRFQVLMDELRGIAEAEVDAEPPISTQPPREPPSNNRGSNNGPSSSGQASGGSNAGVGSNSGGAGSPPSQPAPKAKPPSKTKKSPFLDTSHLSVPPGFPEAVKLTLQELTLINVQRLPNATFDLMRTFLEKSIKAYAEVNGIDLRAEQSVNGYVYLSNCLLWLENRVTVQGPKHLVQVIKKMRSNKVGTTYIVSMDHLNAINHNHHVFVSADEVQTAWSMMVSVLAEVLKS